MDITLFLGFKVSFAICLEKAVQIRSLASKKPDNGVKYIISGIIDIFIFGKPGRLARFGLTIWHSLRLL